MLEPNYQKLVQALEPIEYAVLNLRIDGHTTQEIAKQLDLNIQEVKTIHKKLQEKLATLNSIRL